MEEPTPTPPKRRNGRATTRRILEAAVRIMHEQGPQHVTTLRLAEASGIVQSGFYAHFRNVDEALVAAAEHAGQQVREVVRGGQFALLALGGGSVEQLAGHFRAVLGALLAERPFTELYLQYRRSPTALGRALGRFEAEILSDTAALLARLTHPVDGTPTATDRRQAERIVALFWSALDALLQGDPDQWALDEAALHLAVLSKVSMELTYRGPPPPSFLQIVTFHLLD